MIDYRVHLKSRDRYKRTSRVLFGTQRFDYPIR